MNDLISRQATIDAMEGVDWYHINKDGQLTPGANSKEDEPLYKAEDVYKVLNTMPYAQPEKRTEERTETHGVCLDAIDRQAVIDTVRKIILGFFSDEDGVMNDTEKTLLSVNKAVCNGVRELSPSPIRPHGKWLPEYGDVNAKAHYCSVCEFYYTTDPDEMHYCPHCGADMRKDGEADGINNMPTQ